MTSKLLAASIILAFSQFSLSDKSLKIFPDVNELVIGKKDTLSLNCTNDEPMKWVYQKGELGRRYGSVTLFSSEQIVKKYRSDFNDFEHEVIELHNKTIHSWTENGTYFNTLTINPGHYLETGYYICQTESNASNAAHIYVYVYDENAAIDPNEHLVHAFMYENATIPCKPTSPNISVSLTLNNMEVEPIEKYDPKVGYVISTYPIIDRYTRFLCSNLKTGMTHSFTLVMYPPQNKSSNPHIEVTDSQSNHAIFENQTAMLNCSVITSTDVGIHSIEWEFPRNVAETQKINMGNGTEIKHEEFNTYFRILNIYNLSRHDEGNYACRVTDGNFKTKVYTHFLSLEDPRAVFLNISVPEESRVITGLRGKSVEFTASVKSSPKHIITWYDPLGNEMDTSSIKYNGTEDVSTIELTISGLTLDNSGTYRLNVRNTKLTKTMNFSLIVQDRPQVNLKGFYYKGFKLFKMNTAYDFECVISGYPVPQVEWSAKICENYSNCENGAFQRIPPTMHEEKTIETYKMKSTLHFKSNQSVIVQCEANNSLGFSNVSFPFLVTDYENSTAVVINNHPAQFTVGEDVEITCTAPKYYFFNTFEWMYAKNSTRNSQKNRIIPSTEIQIQNSTTNFSYISTLFIRNVQKHHGGMYICQTTLNRIGRFTIRTNSSSASLTVLEPKPPTIVHSMMKNGVWYVHSGTLVHLLIQVDGMPPPSVVWYKDEKPISFNDRITVSRDYRNLSIASTSHEDEGVYSFIASNSVGNVTDRLQLSIRVSQGSEYFLHIVIGILIFISVSLTAMVVLYLVWRLYVAKMKLKKVLEEYGLHEQEGNEASLDPNLNIQEQTFFIPYNKKYEFPKNKLELGEELGSGAFGVVQKAVANGILVKGVKTTVAVKMAKRQNDSSCVKALTSELKIMIYLGQHLNVVNLLGACTQDLLEGELAVMVEYCKYGNLRDFLLENRSNFTNQINEHDEIDYSIIISNCYENMPLIGEPETKKSTQAKYATIGAEARLAQNYSYNPEWCCNSNGIAVNTRKTTIQTADLICWSYQCARGMQFLANRKILHGDLAARNVLLAEGNIAKICDFGFAKSMDLDEEYKSSKTVFPVKWLAIESLLDKVFSTQSDVWAFGITMWEFFSLAVSPYSDLKIASASDLYYKLYSGYRMEKPKFATNKIYDLMINCWNQNPNLRPSFAQLSQELGTLLEDITQSPNIASSETDGDECSATEYSTILNSPEFDNSGRKQVRHQYVNWSPEVVNNPSNFELTDVSKDTDAAVS